jgi:hypothetical protein
MLLQSQNIFILLASQVRDLFRIHLMGDPFCPDGERLYQTAYHYYFEYYTIYAIIILKNGVKCEVRKWKLN